MWFFDTFKKNTSSQEETPIEEVISIVNKDEIDYLSDEDIKNSKVSNISTNLDDLSDIVSLIDEPDKKIVIESKEEELKKIEVEVKKQVKEDVKKSIERQFKSLSPKTKAVISNLFLIFCVGISIYLIYGTVVPTLKSIEIYKSDRKKVDLDLKIVDKNLKLLEDSTKDAFEYRRLNDLLEQSVPVSDNYEDNILVILNLLKDSITTYSKNQKLLEALAIKPNVEIKDIQYFQLDWEKILGIEYNLSVNWFEKYQYIKDFLTSISDRLKVFHIQGLAISKVLNRETQKEEYSVSFVMFSYYKVPKVSEDWTIEKEKVENTFK